MAQKILIVEDNRLIALSLQKELQLFGYEVMKAHSGDDAIQHAIADKPSLVLMDIHLGEQKNGIEIMQIIHKTIGFIPNIYVTGYAENEISKQAEITSPFLIMDKPVHISQLKKTLTDCFNTIK